MPKKTLKPRKRQSAKRNKTQQHQFGVLRKPKSWKVIDTGQVGPRDADWYDNESRK